jgi:hypothetical protein
MCPNVQAEHSARINDERNHTGDNQSGDEQRCNRVKDSIACPPNKDGRDDDSDTPCCTSAAELSEDVRTLT